MTRLTWCALALLLVPTLSACTVRSRARVTTPAPPSATVSVQTPPQQQTVVVQQPTPNVTAGQGVTVIQPTCQAQEICGDGIDNNCNGYIDDGCGFQSGQIQINLAWGTGADLDLYVTDPFGETINYRSRTSGSGGALDVDARGACGRGGETYTVENVYWATQTPPSGRYQIDVHNYSQCRVPGATTATLSISVGGQIIGTYNVTLAERQRQTVAYFDVP